jgi:hypothetical protein
MDYCLYNAIKTPDGTVLWCQHRHDYQTHQDAVSGEQYMNDGLQDTIRRSVNIVPYEDLAIFTSSPFEKVRTVKFWASYGKDGNSPKHYMSLEEMEKTHIEAILRGQKQIKGTEIEKIFLKELDFRVEVFQEHLETVIPPTNTDKKKKKI